MGKSLWDLRREVGDRLQLCAYGISDDDPSGDHTAITDDDVLALCSDNQWTRGWVYFPSLGPFTARVTAFASGILTFAPALSESTVGHAYEVWKTFDPRVVNRTINDILSTRAIYREQSYSAFAPGKTTGYSVPTLASRLVSVEYADDTNQLHPVREYDVRGVFGSFTFDLVGRARSLVAVYPTATLRLTWERYYPTLDREGDETACPDGWLVASVIADLYRGMMPRTQKADREQVKENIALFETEAARMAQPGKGPGTGPRVRITRRVSM